MASLLSAWYLYLVCEFMYGYHDSDFVQVNFTTPKNIYSYWNRQVIYSQLLTFKKDPPQIIVQGPCSASLSLSLLVGCLSWGTLEKQSFVSCRPLYYVQCEHGGKHVRIRIESISYRRHHVYSAKTGAPENLFHNLINRQCYRREEGEWETGSGVRCIRKQQQHSTHTMRMTKEICDKKPTRNEGRAEKKIMKIME